MTLEKFLEKVNMQREPALIIGNPISVDGATFIPAQWKEMVDALSAPGNFVVTIDDTFGKNEYDLMKQLTDRIEVADLYIDGELRQLKRDPNETHLVFQVQPEILSKLEQHFPLRRTVGMVFEY